MHITYEFVTNTIRFRADIDQRSNANNPAKFTLADIDQRITALRDESKQIEDIYKQLAQYVQENSLLVFDNAFVRYLEYFIELEKGQNTTGGNSANVIQNLQKMKTDFEEHVQQFRSVLESLSSTERQRKCALKPENIIDLVKTLFNLPINGRSIREQVDIIAENQENIHHRKEQQVVLSAKADNSQVMKDLIELLS